MSETGNGEDQPQHGEQPSYPPPPMWQPPVPPPGSQPPAYPPPTYQPPNFAPPGYQQPANPAYPPPGYQPPPGYSQPTNPAYPPPGYQQPGFPPPPQYGLPGYPGGGYGLPPPPVPGGRVAGMGKRFVGLLVDSIVLAVPLLIIGASVGAFKTTTTCDAFTGICTRGVDTGAMLTFDFIALLVGVAYSALLVGLTGQTVGHRAAGIRVVNATNGQVIGAGRAALRWIVLSVTGAICTLGYWSPLFDSVRRQGWHDKAVNSVVIPAH